MSCGETTAKKGHHFAEGDGYKGRQFFCGKIGWHRQLPTRVTPTLVTPLVVLGGNEWIAHHSLKSHAVSYWTLPESFIRPWTRPAAVWQNAKQQRRPSSRSRIILEFWASWWCFWGLVVCYRTTRESLRGRSLAGLTARTSAYLSITHHRYHRHQHWQLCVEFLSTVANDNPTLIFVH